MPQMEEEGVVPVKLGTVDTVRAVPAEENPVLIEKSQKNLVTTQMELEPEVIAPVSQGQKLGTLTLRAGEQILAQVPLVAETSIEKLSWGQMFKRVIKSVCLG
jgi:D-alanyl-D-alanine carboxypeptidase (penicillin-binding protein 5/6)